MQLDDAVDFSPSGNVPSVLSLQGALKDVLFGSIAGIVSEVFEYPFDLAKVRLQSQLLSPANHKYIRFSGPMHCLKYTWQEEGVRGLYRGLPVPVVGSMAETAALFLSYNFFQNLIRTYSLATNHPTPLSLSQLTLAAGGAGLVTSFILTPIELVKCKMQVQMMNYIPKTYPSSKNLVKFRSISTILSPHSTSLLHNPPTAFNFFPNAHYTTRLGLVSSVVTSPPTTQRPPGIISVLTTIVRSHGVAGLWLGHTGTMLRETGGSASWFVTKEWVARLLLDFRAGTDSTYLEQNMTLLPWESALSGAIAGVVGALLFYPADTVKSAMQTEEEMRSGASAKALSNFSGPRSTFLNTLARMHLLHGVRGLYSGCAMTVARAVPSSAIIFLVYDGLTAWLS